MPRQRVLPFHQSAPKGKSPTPGESQGQSSTVALGTVVRNVCLGVYPHWTGPRSLHRYYRRLGLSLQAAARRDAGVESRYFGIVSGRSLRASTFAP